MSLPCLQKSHSIFLVSIANILKYCMHYPIDQNGPKAAILTWNIIIWMGKMLNKCICPIDNNGSDGAILLYESHNIHLNNSPIAGPIEMAPVNYVSVMKVFRNFQDECSTKQSPRNNGKTLWVKNAIPQDSIGPIITRMCHTGLHCAYGKEKSWSRYWLFLHISWWRTWADREQAWIWGTSLLPATKDDPTWIRMHRCLLLNCVHDTDNVLTSCPRHLAYRHTSPDIPLTFWDDLPGEEH